MPSVYDTENFQGRVSLAALYISKGRETTRSFDTCFEMWDGDAVAVALLRRAERNPLVYQIEELKKKEVGITPTSQDKHRFKESKLSSCL